MDTKLEEKEITNIGADEELLRIKRRSGQDLVKNTRKYDDYNVMNIENQINN